MAAQQYNPFGSLVTPDVLAQQRAAQLEQEYANADPFVKMAAKAGFQMRQKAIENGQGLTEEDIKAQRNQNIMSGAQSKYSELVKDGKMSADEAQAEVLQEAIAGFAANGSWEQALALTGPLNQLRSQALERRKLKAEAVFQETRPDLEAEKAAAATTRAETAQKLADLRAEIAEAKTGAEVARLWAQVAALEAKAEKDSRAPGPGGEEVDDSVFGRKQRVMTNEAVMGAATAAQLMTTIKQVGIDNPRALTAAGPIMTQLATISETSKALMMGKGYTPADIEKDGDRASRIIRDNIDDQRLQSATLDLAFAFARARDPGGRLSNQDVEKAIEIVSGKGSPQARRATLDQAFNQMKRQTEALVKVKKSEGYGPTPEAMTLYEEAMAGYGAAGPKPKATAKPDADGWTTLPNGARVREKK